MGVSEMATGLAEQLRYLSAEFRDVRQHQDWRRELMYLIDRVSQLELDVQRLGLMQAECCESAPGPKGNLSDWRRSFREVFGYLHGELSDAPKSDELGKGQKYLSLAPGAVSILSPDVFEPIYFGVVDADTDPDEIEERTEQALNEHRFQVLGYYAKACELLADLVDKRSADPQGVDDAKTRFLGACGRVAFTVAEIQSLEEMIFHDEVQASYTGGSHWEKRAEENRAEMAGLIESLDRQRDVILACGDAASRCVSGDERKLFYRLLALIDGKQYGAFWEAWRQSEQSGEDGLSVNGREAEAENVRPDGLYDSERLFIWGGRQFDRLAKRMMRVLGVLLDAKEKGFPNVPGDELKRRADVSASGGFKSQVFRVNRKDWPGGPDPVSITVLDNGDGTYRLIDPDKVPGKVPGRS